MLDRIAVVSLFDFGFCGSNTVCDSENVYCRYVTCDAADITSEEYIEILLVKIMPIVMDYINVSIQQ